jgi:hypothetical protein
MIEPTPNIYKVAFEKLKEFQDMAVTDEHLKIFYAEANAYFMNLAHFANDSTLNGFTGLLRKIRGEDN